MIASIFLASLLSFNNPHTGYLAQYDRAADRLEEIREDRLERMEERRDVMENRIEERSENREEFRERVREIRDERVQTRLQNISERFSSVSEKWTEHWTNVLSRLEDLITKIETRADDAGIESQELDQALADAKEAVRVANGEVEQFLSTEFDFDLSDEESIGENTRELISQFKQSASDASSSVRIAKDAVKNAFEILRSLVSENAE